MKKLAIVFMSLLVCATLSAQNAQDYKAFIKERKAVQKLVKQERAVQVSKQVIVQSIGRVITVVECYRELKNKNVEVEVFSNSKRKVVYSEGLTQKNNGDGATYESAGRNALKRSAKTIWDVIKPFVLGE